MNLRTIHIWGDSIGKGVVFDELRNRYALAPNRCAVQLQNILGVPIQNHARMGATIVDGFNDLLDVSQKSNEIDGSIIAIEYGGNDCDLNWAEIARNPDATHEAKVPLDTFRNLLTQFVRQIRKLGGHPLLITPPPLDAQRYFNWVTKTLDAAAVLKFLGDVQHIYRWQERYALAVQTVAHQENCDLIDVRDRFLAQRNTSDYLCIDGIHPNSKGQSLITELVLAHAAGHSLSSTQR